VKQARALNRVDSGGHQRIREDNCIAAGADEGTESDRDGMNSN
jgi:hypothetical protein